MAYKKLNGYYTKIAELIIYFSDKEYIIAKIKAEIDKVYDLGVADGFCEGYQEGRKDFSD